MAHSPALRVAGSRSSGLHALRGRFGAGGHAAVGAPERAGPAAGGAAGLGLVLGRAGRGWPRVARAAFNTELAEKTGLIASLYRVSE
jgi:hypothetical protein